MIHPQSAELASFRQPTSSTPTNVQASNTPKSIHHLGHQNNNNERQNSRIKQNDGKGNSVYGVHVIGVGYRRPDQPSQEKYANAQQQHQPVYATLNINTNNANTNTNNTNINNTNTNNTNMNTNANTNNANSYNNSGLYTRQNMQLKQSPMSVPYGTETANIRKIQELKQTVDAIKNEQDQRFRYIERQFKPNKPLPKNTEQFEKSKSPIPPAHKQLI